MIAVHPVGSYLPLPDRVKQLNAKLALDLQAALPPFVTGEAWVWQWLPPHTRNCTWCLTFDVMDVNGVFRRGRILDVEDHRLDDILHAFIDGVRHYGSDVEMVMGRVAILGVDVRVRADMTDTP